MVLVKEKKQLKETFEVHLKQSEQIKRDNAMKEIKYAILLTRRGVSLNF